MKRIKDGYKKYIIILLMITLLSLTYGIKYLNKSKYEELPEVKLKKKIEKNKSFAIMVQNENGNDYVKYTEDKWPSSGYKFKEAKCTDNNGNMVENAITFESATKTVILETDKTVVCTLYFDVLFNGKGTKDNPYKINYIEDLVDLQVAVNNGETYKGKYFTLEKSLDFNIESDYQNYQSKEYGDINGNGQDEELKTELITEAGWKPIGNTETNSFQGIFDGNNNKLLNLYINQTNKSNEAIGLFGSINNAIIKKLIVNGINSSTVESDKGGIIGRVYGTTILENLVNNVELKSNINLGNQGGIVGKVFNNANLTITNCFNNATITNNNYTGGIIGYNCGNLVINNCYNKGAIIGSYVGGLIGRVDTSTNKIIIINSYNVGNITGTYRIGGLIGLLTGNTIINNCHNEGELVGNAPSGSVDHVGGLIGHFWQNYSGTIKLNIINSYNSGNIIDNSNNSWVGGIVAVNNIIGQDNQIAKINLINTYNIGNIEINNGIASGIIRINSEATLNNVYNAGIIKSSTKNGIGFIVDTLVSSINIDNTYYENSINGSNNSGPNIKLTPMSLDNMKEISFVDILNKNKDTLNQMELFNIDSSLSGYTLCNWKLGESGFPEIEC